MKILITGGAGFIGSHLVDQLLKKGEIVVSVDNFSNGKKAHLNDALKNKNFHLNDFDLLEKEKLDELFKKEKFDLVYHLAANSDIQAGSRDVEVDLNNTFISTFNVLSCMKTHGVREIIFASSSAIYGELDQELSEKVGPLFPISNYGAAKLSSEAYISAFCANYNMKSWIIRFPNVIGWRLTHGVIYDFMNKLEKDPSELSVLGNGKQQKPYLYVDDLLYAIECIYRNSNDMLNYFNVSASSDTTVTEIANIVIQKCGSKDTKLSFTREDRGWVGDVPKFKYDTSKINSLKWKPSYTSTEAVKLSVEKELIYRNRIL
jgi:UDP-glucose 4-epimerase